MAVESLYMPIAEDEQRRKDYHKFDEPLDASTQRYPLFADWSESRIEKETDTLESALRTALQPIYSERVFLADPIDTAKNHMRFLGQRRRFWHHTTDQIHEPNFPSIVPDPAIWGAVIHVPQSNPEPEQMLGMFDDLMALLCEEEDEDTSPATQYAVSKSLRLLVTTRDLTGIDIPPARLTTTEKGGVNFYWMKADYSVQLTVGYSATAKSYIYVREGDVSSIDDSVSAANLAKQLREFMLRPK